MNAIPGLRARRVPLPGNFRASVGVGVGRSKALKIHPRAEVNVHL